MWISGDIIMCKIEVLTNSYCVADPWVEKVMNMIIFQRTMVPVLIDDNYS